MCFKCCMILRSVLKHEILDYPLSENELRCLHVTKRQDDTCSTSLTPLGNQHMEYAQQFKKKKNLTVMEASQVLGDTWHLINVTLPKTPLWTCHKDRVGTHSKFGLDVKTGNAKHTRRGYERVSWSHNEAFWEEQAAPRQAHNGLRERGRSQLGGFTADGGGAI